MDAPRGHRMRAPSLACRRRRTGAPDAATRALMQPAVRDLVERAIQALIDALDAADAATEDLEPDHDDEIVSEDDAVIADWRPVGRQA